jgi:S-adenosylmethionine synthetase
MDLLTNDADITQPWVRAFMRRLGYMLAAEWADMPDCELRDMIGEQSSDIIDMVHAFDEAEKAADPTLRLVD